MATGTVKWFHRRKGYGFINGSNGEDVFVHYSVIEGDGYKILDDGEEVDYEFEKGDKGYKASCVKRNLK